MSWIKPILLAVVVSLFLVLWGQYAFNNIKHIDQNKNKNYWVFVSIYTDKGMYSSSIVCRDYNLKKESEIIRVTEAIQKKWRYIEKTTSVNIVLTGWEELNN